MKPGTGDGDWHVMTELVLSPPLWPEGLQHGFRRCAEGDAVAPHSCVGAFGRPGAPHSHLRLTLLHARADISLSLLLTHCQSLSSAEGFPGGIRRPSDNPAFSLGGAMGTCAQPGVQPKLAGWVTAPQGSLLAATATVTVPICCSGILGRWGTLAEGPACYCAVWLSQIWVCLEVRWQPASCLWPQGPFLPCQERLHCAH